MNRRAALATILAMPLLLMLPVGCGSQEGGAPETPQSSLGKGEAESIQELTLRIEGMT